MKKPATLLILGAVLALAACPAKDKPSEESAPAAAEQPEAKPTVGVVVPDGTKKMFAALPAEYASPDNPLTDEKIALGRMLYFDARLSKNQDVSCNSCHALDSYGVDGQPTSPGHKGQLGGRNSPTVYNAGAHVAQFWDGRAADLEEQAGGPVLNPVEMAMPDEASVLKVLNSVPGYVEAFKKAFPADKAPVTYANMTQAIGAFERKLVTPAPFDKYIQGDEGALTDAQKKGLNTFVESGCTACHNGPELGGKAYFKLGMVKPWPSESDLGRFDVTKNEADKMVFRVPTLRNVAKTGPYFHDGSVKDLDDAVQKMAVHQLGRELTSQQVAEIVSFLDSLTGELPLEYIKAPQLPPSTAKTPNPDPS